MPLQLAIAFAFASFVVFKPIVEFLALLEVITIFPVKLGDTGDTLLLFAMAGDGFGFGAGFLATGGGSGFGSVVK